MEIKDIENWQYEELSDQELKAVSGGLSSESLSLQESEAVSGGLSSESLSLSSIIEGVTQRGHRGGGGCGDDD